MHLTAPKVAPPGHAESYNPSEEYLPTPEELNQWEQMDVKDRPHGLLVPQKFTSLRAVGAYEHSVRESFERCLDLYLCPRVMKRRFNIDPETLVQSLPKPSDLRPFPTALCLTYETPYEEEEEDVSKRPQGTNIMSTPASLRKIYNDLDPIKSQNDAKAKEIISGDMTTNILPPNTSLKQDIRHEAVKKFGNENLHNISKNSDGHEKAGKGKVRVSSSTAKENQPVQVQFKEKSLITVRHSLGSEGAALFSTAFPAMVLPTTNSEKITAAMDLEIRRLVLSSFGGVSAKTRL
jgi:hypothetical protein